MFENLLLLLHAVVSVFLIILVLLQRSEGGMGSMGGGGSSSMMSESGAADGMTKATAILATIFMISSILLAVQSSGRSHKVSVTDVVKVEDTPPVTKEASTTPIVPDVPAN